MHVHYTSSLSATINKIVVLPLGLSVYSFEIFLSLATFLMNN